VYKHALERSGVRSAIRCRQTRGTRLRSCLVPQGIRSAWLKRCVDMRELTGLTARRKASWVVPPFSLDEVRESHSPAGEDGGAILVRRVNPSSCSRDRARGGSCRSAWNRCDGARGRHGTSEDGTISVKAPPAVARCDEARGVSIQNAERRCRAVCSGAVPESAMAGSGDRGCIGFESVEAGVSE